MRRSTALAFSLLAALSPAPETAFAGRGGFRAAARPAAHGVPLFRPHAARVVRLPAGPHGGPAPGPPRAVGAPNRFRRGPKPWHRPGFGGYGYAGWAAPWYGAYGSYAAPSAVVAPIDQENGVRPADDGPDVYRACATQPYRVPASGGGLAVVRVTRC
jgi:hypothetical protein